MKPLYKLQYRNRSHARLDFSDFIKDINTYLRNTLPKNIKLNVQLKDHFLDRLMDRDADPNYIKKIIRMALERNLCEIIYFANMTNREGIRICFSDTINHVFLSYDEVKKSLTLRSFFKNSERNIPKLNPEFTVCPTSKKIGDEFHVKC